MTNMTLSIPEDLYENMKHFSEIKWSEVARKAIKEKIELLNLAENISKKSKLTEKDIETFSKQIKSLATDKFMR